MPLVLQQNRPTELYPTGPVNVPQYPVADPGDQGTGANGPRYSPLDVAAGAAESTPYGHLENWIEGLARGAGAPGRAAPAGWDRDKAIAATGLDERKDEFSGLDTPDEIARKASEIRVREQSLRAAASAPWGGGAALAMGFGQITSPVDVAAMLIPMANASRLKSAVRMALIGGGATAATEALQAGQPDWDAESAIKQVGAGTILSGILGAGMKHATPLEEFERMRTRLQADLDRPSFDPRFAGATAGSIVDDTADKIAGDLRAAVEAHGQKLVDEATTATQAAAHLNPEEVAGRLAAAGPKPVTAPEPPGAAQPPGGATAGAQPPSPEALAAQQAHADAELLAKADAAKAAAQAFHTPAEPPEIGAKVETRLAATNRYSPEEATAYATLVDRFYGTQAARLGVTPEELWNRYPLNIQTAGEGALAQGLNAPFYSAAVRGVEGLKLEKASPEQWAATLRNLKGVTPEELEWMGVQDFLHEATGPVSREELLDYMRGHALGIEDVTLGGNEAETEEIVSELGREGYIVEEDDVTGEPYLTQRDETGTHVEVADGDVPDHIRDLFDQIRGGGPGAPTQFERFTLPGATEGTYQEHLLKIVGQPEGPDFTGGHFDVPNVVAHVRTNERIDADGNRVLHIEEVQSDWHQKGRRAGYQEQGEAMTARQRGQLLERQLQISQEKDALAKDRLPDNRMRDEPRWHELSREFEDIERRLVGKPHGVPNAPFKKTWPELALKRMVRYAAEKGIDRITWTTGDQQAGRYDLSKEVSSIEYVKTGTGQGTPRDVIEAKDHGHLSAFDKSGRRVIERMVNQADLANYIGKDAAEKLLAKEGTYGNSDGGLTGIKREISGLDLKVGGEGMRGFYDKILPAAAQKLAKRYGGKVGETKIQTEPGRTVNAMTARESQELERLEDVAAKGLGLDDLQRDQLATLYARHQEEGHLEPAEMEHLRALTGMLEGLTPQGAWRLRELQRRVPLTPRELQRLHELTAIGGAQMTHDEFGERLDLLLRDRNTSRPAVIEPVHALDISPEMKQAALGGQPLFQRGQPRGTPSDYGQGDLFRQKLQAATAPPPAVRPAEGRAEPAVARATFARRTELRPQQHFDLPVESVQGPSDAAAASSALAQLGDERFHGLVTDGDGKPLAIIGNFKGTVDAAQVPLESLMLDAFRVPGARNVWWTHNHPSGESRLSRQDEHLNNVLNELFAGSGIQARGILAVGGAERGRSMNYSWSDGHGQDQSGIVLPQATAPMRVPALERAFTKFDGMRGGPVTGPVSAQVFLEKHGFTGDGLLLLDTRHHPVAWIPDDVAFPQPGGATTLRGQGPEAGMGRLLQVLGESNTTRAILVRAGEASINEVKNLDSFFRQFGGQGAGARLLDVVDHMGTKPRSWVEALPDQMEGQGPFKQQAKGAYDPASHTMTLLPQADLSTFLHESGHHFLDIAMQLGAREDAPLELRRDAETLATWMGHDSVEAWHAAGLEEQRSGHEKFANSFERYLRDGTAPSTRLQQIFDKFRDWLVSIYRTSSRMFHAGLSDEVRGVMDRMLATVDEQVAARKARIESAPDAFLARVAGEGPLRDTLRNMIEEAGWIEKGGRHGEEMEPGTRTSWIPRAEWWPGRPGGLNEEEVRTAVEKALAGDRLGARQRQLVEYMTHVADEREASDPYRLHPDDLRAAGLDPDNAHDDMEAAMVSRLRAIDEDAVEALARHFESDDAGFLRAVKAQLDTHDTDAALARGVPQESEPKGISGDGAAAGRPPGEAGARDFTLEAPREPGAPAAAGREARGGAQQDFLGANATRQQLADTERARDAARNTGQQSLETGRPDDLFSEARKQIDLKDLLLQLPEEERAPFEQRIKDLDTHPHYGGRGTPPLPGGLDTTIPGAPGTTLNDYRYARGGRVIGKALSWFAPGMRLLQSPSLRVRQLSVDMLETPEALEMNIPTKDRPYGIATPRSWEETLKKWEGRWALAKRARDQLFSEYGKRTPEEGEPARMSRDEWNANVSAAMRRGDQHAVPEIAKAAQVTRELVFEPLKQEAQKHGLLPGQEEMLRGTAETYLMREYDRAKIRADRAGWNRLLVDGFVKQGVEAQEAWDVADKVTRNLLGAERGLLDMNSVVFRDVVPQSGRLIERRLLLPDTELEPFLKSDVDHLSHSYIRTLAPQVEAAARGWDKDLKGPFQHVIDEYQVLMKKALEAGDDAKANKLTDRMKADLRDLGAARDRIYGIFGVPADPTGWMQRSNRVLRSVNVLRLLGSANFSHLPDLGNVILREGLTRTLVGAAKLLTSIDAMKLTRAELTRMGTANDMVTNVTIASGGEFGAESSYPVQKFLNKASRAYTIATLETPWITGLKTLGGSMAEDGILEAAEKVASGQRISRLQQIRFNQQGVSQMDLERIGTQFREQGRTINGHRFGMSDLWNDGGARQAFEAAVVKHAESATLTPSKGDTPLWTSYEVGKSLFQFKTFGAVAIRKVVIPLAQGLAHGDARAASGLATLIMAGYLSYYVKQKISGQPIEQNPRRLALEVLDKSNLLGWTGEYFYPALWSAGVNNFSRWGDRQTWETLGGPVFGAAVDTWDMRIPAKLRANFGAYDPRDAHFTRADVHRIRRLLPANQLWYLRRAVNALEGRVGDAMGLPPERPRIDRSSTE